MDRTPTRHQQQAQRRCGGDGSPGAAEAVLPGAVPADVPQQPADCLGMSAAGGGCDPRPSRGTDRRRAHPPGPVVGSRGGAEFRLSGRSGRAARGEPGHPCRAHHGSRRGIRRWQVDPGSTRGWPAGTSVWSGRHVPWKGSNRAHQPGDPHLLGQPSRRRGSRVTSHRRELA